MSDLDFPVTVAVRRSDGSIEHVRVGTAVRDGEAFRLTLGELSIGGVPDVRRAAPAAPPPPLDGGLVFPPYGRSKGMPIVGAARGDLEFYAGGCRRTLNDPGKARWHDKEQQLLAAIEAEMARQGFGSSDEPGSGASRSHDGPPEDDIPF